VIDSETFSSEWISSFPEANSSSRKQTIERCVHAFYLLERLAKKGFPFIFKGGTSLMLLLPEPKRFSVDVDIIMDPPYFDKIKKIAFSLRDKRLYKVEEDIRQPADVIKRHFKFYYHSVFQEPGAPDPYVLLDVVFEQSPYLHAQDHEIMMKWLKTSGRKIEVKIPSPEEMLGDKMTAFAPTTIGKLYSEGRYVEICKQLYDVALLSRLAKDEAQIKASYEAVSLIECKNRNNVYTPKQALEDSLETTRLIISEGNRPSEKEYFLTLVKGRNALVQFLINSYGEQGWLSDAAEAYLRYGSIAFSHAISSPAKNSETFVGRRYSLLKRALGNEKMNQLMIMVANDPKRESTKKL
jgi:predicted nucleotidyltransferase component of viral defense system